MDLRVANRKAAAATNAGWGDSASLRNPRVTDPQARARLVIDSGTVTVRGSDIDGARSLAGHFTYQEDGAAPGPPTRVLLGDVHVDDSGRLIFRGGFGKTGVAVDSAFNILRTAGIDTDRWWDDISDGPVSATVRFRFSTQDWDAAEHAVLGAWVVVGPPAYAPPIRDTITIYDRLVDAPRTVARPFISIGYAPPRRCPATEPLSGRPAATCWGASRTSRSCHIW